MTSLKHKECSKNGNIFVRNFIVRQNTVSSTPILLVVHIFIRLFVSSSVNIFLYWDRQHHTLPYCIFATLHKGINIRKEIPLHIQLCTISINYIFTTEFALDSI